MKSRLQALGLLDRAIKSTTDEEVEALVAALDDDHREALERMADGTDPVALRAAAATGRLDGTMESMVLVITDGCLADCIRELGDHADHPSSDQLRAVLPGLVERHGLGATRMMLASTVAGEASASAIIRDLLKHDDLVKLPAAEPGAVTAIPRPSATAEDPEREAVRARRQELKRRKQDEARARREQSARARSRS